MPVRMEPWAILHVSAAAVHSRPPTIEDAHMGNLLYWAVALIIIAIVASFLGFGGAAGTAVGGAQLLIYAAVAIAIIGALVALIRRA
jgi:uncharacterized membrane protein YtjA (UPF0391 family)